MIPCTYEVPDALYVVKDEYGRLVFSPEVCEGGEKVPAGPMGYVDEEQATAEAVACSGQLDCYSGTFMLNYCALCRRPLWIRYADGRTVYAAQSFTIVKHERETYGRRSSSVAQGNA